MIGYYFHKVKYQFNYDYHSILPYDHSTYLLTVLFIILITYDIMILYTLDFIELNSPLSKVDFITIIATIDVNIYIYFYEYH